MVGEQRKSCNGYALNKTRAHPSTTTSTRPPNAPRPTHGHPETIKAARQQVNPYSSTTEGSHRAAPLR